MGHNYCAKDDTHTRIQSYIKNSGVCTQIGLFSKQAILHQLPLDIYMKDLLQRGKDYLIISSNL